MIEIRDYTDDELMAIPPIVLDPGTTDEHGVTRDKLLRNPFLPDGRLAEDEPRATLARRWSQLHWNKPSAPTPAYDMVDPLDAMLERLDVLDGKSRKPWHEVHNADGELVAVHPLGVAPSSVADWERTCREMHAAQRMVLPPDKPGQPLRQVPVVESTEPQPFEDSDESKQMRGLRRGD